MSSLPPNPNRPEGSGLQQLQQSSLPPKKRFRAVDDNPEDESMAVQPPSLSDANDTDSSYDTSSDDDDEYEEGDSEADDDSDIGLQKRRFKREPNMSNFGNLIVAFQMNADHHCRTRLFKQIWHTTAEMHDLPRNNHAEVELVFYGLVSILESSGDPNGFRLYRRPPPPYKFLEQVLEQASQMLGSSHVIVNKMWLLKIFLSTSVAEECRSLLEKQGSASLLEVLRRRFPAASVPHPDTGTWLDDLALDDSLLDIRYTYAKALVYAEAGSKEEAGRTLELTLQPLRLAEQNATYLLTRGQEDAKDDLFLCWAKILRALGGIILELGEPERGVTFLNQAVTLELANAQLLELPPGYVSYLREVSAFGAESHELLDLTKHRIPSRYMDGVALFVRAQTSLMCARGRQDPGLTMMDGVINFFQNRLECLSGEGVEEHSFSELLTHSLYLLVLQRFRSKSALATPNSRELSESHLQYVREVRSQYLEDEVGPEYLSIVVQAVDTLRWTAHNREDEDSLSFVRDAAKFHLAEHSVEALEQARGQLHINAADLYEVLAETSYKLGDLGGYLRSTFFSRYVAAVSPDRQSRIRAKKDEKRFKLAKRQLLWGLENEETLRLHDVVSLEFSGLESLEDARVQQAGEDATRVKPLKALTRDFVTKTYSDHLKLFDMLLQSTELQNAFDEIRHEKAKN
jgi:hypothetical protein